MGKKPTKGEETYLEPVDAAVLLRVEQHFAARAYREDELLPLQEKQMPSARSLYRMIPM